MGGFTAIGDKTLSAEQDALRTEMEEESEALYKEAIAGLAARAKEEGINPIEYNTNSKK